MAVLTWADPALRTSRSGRVYALAMGAQVLLDTVVAVVRSASVGVAPRSLVRPLGWTFAVDALLGAGALAAVVAAGPAWPAVLLLAAPVALVRLLASDRARSLAVAVTLGDAYTEASEQARRDQLSGLANRRAWAEAIVASDDSGPDGDRALVLAADLDGLKIVNDTCGHGAGDDLIRRPGGDGQDGPAGRPFPGPGPGPAGRW